ncbi:MAG: oligosaccharide flippase family protein [bacterium]|nr:oligosaccharide flippase family protein [bacterium]
MLQSIKRLTRHSAVYGIGHIVSRSISFLLLPIHTNCLPPDQYGRATLLFSTLAILQVLFSYGLDVAFLRFFILGADRREKERVFSTAFWMIFITGVIFSSVLLLNPGFFSGIIFRSDRFATLIRLSAGICLADALRLLPFLTLRAEEKPVEFVLQNSFNIVATLVLNLVFVVRMGMGIEGIFWANLIASVLTLISTARLFIRWLRPVFSKPVLAELMRFGIPYVPSTLAVVIMDQISRFFVDRMIGPEANGLFSAGAKFGMFMSLVVAAFRFAWHPFFLSTAKQKDAPAVFGRVLTYFAAVTGFLFLLFSLFIREIGGISFFGFRLIGAEFTSGLSIVPPILLAYVFYGAYANFIVGVYLKKKTAWLPFITGTGALVAVAGNILLIPLFGIHGAAWSITLAYAVMAGLLWAVNRKLYPIPYEWGRIFKIAAVTAFLYILGTFTPAGHSAWLRVGLLLAALPMLLAVRFFKQGEIRTFRRWLKRLTG